jgi:pyroglutamyl-peptidase
MAGVRLRVVLASIVLLAAAGCADDSTVAEDVPDAGDVADVHEASDVADVVEVAPIAITTDALPGGRVQLPYSAQLEVVDAAGEVAWEVTDGALPPGLALGGDGAISGLPERSGLYEFEVTADDGATSDSVALSIAVPKVLLMSGFEPFGEFAINSSYESLEPFDGTIVDGLDVRVVELAVVWGDSWDELAAEIDRLHPDAVIATGQAGPEGMRFETAARNEMNGTDNEGVTMTDATIVDGAPYRLRASYPIDEMRAAMEESGFPTLVSSDAGEYLCNYVMYRLVHFHESAEDGPAAAGFIHVPPVPMEGAMTVEEITAAHRLGIGALAAWLASGGEAKAAVPDFHAPPRYFF